MKNCFTISLLLFLSSLSYTQTFNKEQQDLINSCINTINNPDSPDTSLVESYVNLSGILYINNVDTIVPLCKKAEKIAKERLKQNPDTKERHVLLKSLAGALNNIGYYIDNYKGQSDIAIKYYEESLEIQKLIKDSSGIATSINNIAEIYRKQSKIPFALANHHKGLKISTAINHQQGMALSLHNIALIHRQQGDFKLALDYNLKSLKIKKKINDKIGVSNSLNNIGTIHLAMLNFDLALDYFNQSLTIRTQLGNQTGMSNSYNNIGKVYQAKGKLKLALEYYYKALKLEETLNRDLGITRTLYHIAEVELQLGNLKKAEQLGKRSLLLAQKLGFPQEIHNSSLICYQVKIKLQKWKEALDLRNLQITMKDSLENESSIKAAANEQAKYEYEKSLALSKKEHEKQLAIEQEAKAKQKVIIISIGISLGLVALFLFFVFTRLKVTRKQKEIIEMAHIELEEKNKEITSSIQYAKRIQKAILPPQKLVKKYFNESFIIYLPKDIVAGDFYWMEQVKNTILFAAADCTGHGVPGAMVSVVCNNGLNRSVREYGLTDPGKILDKTREIVIQEFEKSEEDVKDGMDIALCSLEGNKLQYAGANNPLWIVRNKKIIEIKADKQPIGKFEKPQPYTSQTIELKKNDSIYIFSDGFVDQFGGPKGKKYKAKALKELLCKISNEELKKQKEIIENEFYNWKGSLEQIDDICIIGVKI